ncbi:hypothetical protein GRO01_00780 [Gluconobacter roseus NBRC 3990]|uniref:Ketoreductase (KR) domain-containing protein n=1 Tax=Gluconobacter roseus NBRC 3990 TaxID=1307950 RepID=A0A4Y3LZT7_9PROT|nr:hypothetical protein AA3990_0637 [Gluconobacter roseus NBRC 3990]GEB02502.1 hypothetical protein GRO01_00780 [Gluconobacter roseus NBRC 3990]GLP92963.1 hypothetical protein GCM10007871_09410 [Gluconobacter roseus NBRC 3990]
MLNLDLSGRTALVTGSTGGIGLAIARKLGEAGATVIINGRKQDSIDGALEKLGKAVPGGTFRSVVADVGTPEGCKTLFEAESSIDILINNAGIFGPNDFSRRRMTAGSTCSKSTCSPACACPAPICRA